MDVTVCPRCSQSPFLGSKAVAFLCLDLVTSFFATAVPPLLSSTFSVFFCLFIYSTSFFLSSCLGQQPSKFVLILEFTPSFLLHSCWGPSASSEVSLLILLI